MQVTTRKCSTREPKPCCIIGTAATLAAAAELPWPFYGTLPAAAAAWSHNGTFEPNSFQIPKYHLEFGLKSPSKLQLEKVVQRSQNLAALKVLRRRRDTVAVLS